MAAVIAVDVWSDVACPWCYIGKRRFEAGVRQYRANGGDAEIALTFHSFELAPDTPVDFEGTEVDFLARHKGLPESRVRELLDHVTREAAGEDLAYDFANLHHTRTIKAHQVLHLAKAHGLQVELKERLLAAYFVEGRHVGHDSDLADLAVEVGLDRDEVLAALADGRYAADVQADIDQARAYGINGVPFFVFGSKYGVSGAQPADVFAQVLAQVSAEA